jgi:hypothetical protein
MNRNRNWTIKFSLHREYPAEKKIVLKRISAPKEWAVPNVECGPFSNR